MVETLALCHKSSLYFPRRSHLMADRKQGLQVTNLNTDGVIILHRDKHLLQNSRLKKTNKLVYCQFKNQLFELQLKHRDDFSLRSNSTPRHGCVTKTPICFHSVFKLPSCHAKCLSFSLTVSKCVSCLSYSLPACLFIFLFSS